MFYIFTALSLLTTFVCAVSLSVVTTNFIRFQFAIEMYCRWHSDVLLKHTRSSEKCVQILNVEPFGFVERKWEEVYVNRVYVCHTRMTAACIECMLTEAETTLYNRQIRARRVILWPANHNIYLKPTGYKLRFPKHRNLEVTGQKMCVSHFIEIAIYHPDTSQSKPKLVAPRKVQFICATSWQRLSSGLSHQTHFAPAITQSR